MSFLLPVVFMLLMVACGGTAQPTPAQYHDIEATVEVRLQDKLAEDTVLEVKAQAMVNAMVEATDQAAPTATPVPATATSTATPLPTTSPPTPYRGEQLEYGNNTLHYLPSVTEQEAQGLLDYLVIQGFFDSENDNDVQLRKARGVYELRMPLREGIDPDDTDIKEGLSFTACAVESDVFINSTVHWLVVGDSFDDIKKRYRCTAHTTSSGSVSNLGERLSHHNNSLYYLSSVTQQEAQGLLDYLVFQDFFDSETETDVQLRKAGGVYELRMPLREGIDPDDTDIKETISLFTCSLESDVFIDSTVHWLVVGDSFDDIKKRYRCMAPTASSGSVSNLGERLSHHNNSLYYLSSVTQQEAQKLLDYLVFQAFFNSETETDVQLRKAEGVYELRVPLREGIDPDDTDIKEMIILFICSIEGDVFTDSTVHWLAVGDSFDEIKKRYIC